MYHRRSFTYYRDMETIMYELCRKDTAYVESIRAKKELDVKRDPKNKLPPVFFTVMDKVKDMLGENDYHFLSGWMDINIGKP